MKLLLFICAFLLSVHGQKSIPLQLVRSVPDSTDQEDSQVEFGDSLKYNDAISLSVPSLTENFPQFYMEIVTPNPWVDYKIMISKPNPGIDYKMLIKDVQNTMIIEDVIIKGKR